MSAVGSIVESETSCLGKNQQDKLKATGTGTATESNAPTLGDPITTTLRFKALEPLLILLKSDPTLGPARCRDEIDADGSELSVSDCSLAGSSTEMDLKVRGGVYGGLRDCCWALGDRWAPSPLARRFQCSKPVSRPENSDEAVGVVGESGGSGELSARRDEDGLYSGARSDTVKTRGVRVDCRGGLYIAQVSEYIVGSDRMTVWFQIARICGIAESRDRRL